jgi:hypothetical protein
VFNWKVRRNLDPYFRAVYAMQLIAACAVVAGLFLAWWGGGHGDHLTAFDILDRSTMELRQRKPTGIVQPLVVLWLLWPFVIVAGLRSFTGILVTPVWYRRLTLAAWVPALLALLHFYINFGDQVAADSPLKDGHIQIGFWLTASSVVILGLLILAEGTIKEPDDTWAAQGPTGGGPVEDAERLWRGEYQSCPYCGMLNEPQARTCVNCHNLLFNFEDDR